MRSSWRREVTELLAQLDPTAGIEPHKGGHVRITLSNGARITTGATPGDWRAFQNLRSDIRRALRMGPRCQLG